MPQQHLQSLQNADMMVRSLLTPAGDGSGQYTLSQYEVLRSMATGPSFNAPPQQGFNPGFNAGPGGFNNAGPGGFNNAGPGGFNPQAAFNQQAAYNQQGNQGMGFGGFDGYGGGPPQQFGGGYMQQQQYFH
jgi:hypothetical protein